MAKPKTATITVAEHGGKAPAADKDLVVVEAEVEAARTRAAETKTLRTKAYSNDNWTRRRWRMDLILIFLCVCTAYLVFLAPDDELRRSLTIPILGTLASIILGYMGFATMDDSNKRTSLAISDPAVEPE